MATQLELGDISVDVEFKDIKNVHLSVYPPTGRVCVSAPSRMSLDTVRVYAISKLGWIKKQQKKFQQQERETKREYLDQESHYLWGKRYLLEVIERDIKPRVWLERRTNSRCELCGVAAQQEVLEVERIVPMCEGGAHDPSNLILVCASCRSEKHDPDDGDNLVASDLYRSAEGSHIVLRVRPFANEVKKREVMEGWYRKQLRIGAAQLIKKWERLLNVAVEKLYVQRMKTKWGGCNSAKGHIRLNTELAKKPPECLEYIVVHEMVHLLEPTHNVKFVALMDEHVPQWRHYRDMLNRLPVAHDEWDY